jgi:enediyne biosynthesis protein E5
MSGRDARSQPERPPMSRGASPAQPASAAATPRKLVSLDNPYVVPVFITGILLVGHLTFGILEGYDKTLLAIAVSIALELALGRIFHGKWVHPASAYITGISVGILVRSPAYWPYALCSALSITSKYVLRVNGRHLWNPSNFGISAMLFLAGDAVGSLSIQWGNYLWPMLVIWILGALIIWRLRRFHITATYVASFIAYALVRSWLTGTPWQAEIAPITGPMYQLFIFFMITDPKTTVKSKRGQCLVAFAVASLEMVLRLQQSVYAPYYALFIVGPTALLIEMWLASRRARTETGAAR